jgi:hypothetical protein
MKFVNARMSTPSSSSSGTVSHARTAAPTPRPRATPVSVGAAGFVMPISVRYASPAKLKRLACWAFQPKRPTLMPCMLGRPEMPQCVSSTDPTRFRISSAGMASTRPPPNSGVAWRNEWNSASGGGVVVPRT